MASTRLYNAKGEPITVNDNYVDSFLAKGFTTKGLSSSQIATKEAELKAPTNKRAIVPKSGNRFTQTVNNDSTNQDVINFNNMSPSEKENERKYLSSLSAKGGGNAEWAEKQAALYGISLALPLKNTQRIEDTFVATQTGKQQTITPETAISGSQAPRQTGSVPPTELGAVPTTEQDATANQIGTLETTIAEMKAQREKLASDNEANRKAGVEQFGSILELIRSGSASQKEEATARIKQRLEENLFNLGEEGILAGEEFASAERQAESQGILAARNLQERLAQGGVTGLEAGKFLKSQEASTRGRVAEIGTMKLQDTLGRNRLVNQVKSASKDELGAILAGIDSAEMSDIVSQLNSDREFDLASESQKVQIMSGVLQNQLLALELDNYPENRKRELEAFQLDIDAGKVNLKTAEFQFKQLQDPDSVYNKVRQIELDTANFEADQQRNPNSVTNQIRQIELDISRAEAAEITDPDSISNKNRTVQLQQSLLDLKDTEANIALKIKAINSKSGSISLPKIKSERDILEDEAAILKLNLLIDDLKRESGIVVEQDVIDYLEDGARRGYTALLDIVSDPANAKGIAQFGLESKAQSLLGTALVEEKARRGNLPE